MVAAGLPANFNLTQPEWRLRLNRTGRELGLLWHAPGWVEGPALAAGARATNYKTVGTDLGYTWIQRQVGSSNAWTTVS